MKEERLANDQSKPRTASDSTGERLLSGFSTSEAHALLSTKADRAVSAIIVMELRSGAIVYWNPAAESLFGYEPREVLGQPLLQLIPKDYRAAHLAALEYAGWKASGADGAAALLGIKPPTLQSRIKKLSLREAPLRHSSLARRRLRERAKLGHRARSTEHSKHTGHMHRHRVATPAS